MNYVIGVDLGTSATKTILVDENGKICADSEYSYRMYEPQNGWAEQDPKDWAEAVLSTIKDVVEKSRVKPEEVAGIGLSGQMHGLVMLDDRNKPIGRTILWCDQRSSEQADEMLSLMPMEKWLDISANPPIAAWTAAKILWVRENRPEAFARCRHILLPKDYIRFVLTGVYATDVSDASGMQILDVRNRCWSDEILKVLDIDPDMLGKLHESNEVTGHLLPEIAELCGLTTETKVVAGGSDNACAAIGSGVVREGQAFVTLGTSSVVYSHFDHYLSVENGGLHVCCCAVPGCWHSMGGPMAAGLSMEWFKDNFCQNLEQRAKESGKSFFSFMTEQIQEIPIGSDHLIYLPFLMGERTPHMDPYYRGAFLGLNTVHTQAHLLRAIMEGIGFCLADCNDLLKKEGVNITSLRVCGGGSANPVYRQILADLFRCNIFTLKDNTGAALGAAILAGTGCGIFPDIREACDQFVKTEERIPFNEQEADIYEKYHRIYDDMYFSLKNSFKKLAEI